MPTGGGIPQPPPAKVPTGRCRMPGCNGNIIDGYCDVCGSPAGATEASSAPRSPSTGQTSVTRASSLLSSTALGSARAGGAASRSTKRIRETAKRLRAGTVGRRAHVRTARSVRRS